MAEAMAIIGLAFSIATFIQMGFAIVKTGRTVLESGHGTMNEAHELTLIVKDIDKRVDDFLQISNRGHSGKHEKEIRSIAAECKRVAQELQRILSSLASSEKVRSRVLEAGKTTIVAFIRRRRYQVSLVA
ncbi:hypothetical protein Daus18300_006740 [Diaporthe australafricana]|uniref:Fungal N-terminal domain-containing protein n=1 Tax=Diaporthe australafricana TaxID=127596 RepID=A0ABR3WSU0_9PEZI